MAECDCYTSRRWKVVQRPERPMRPAVPCPLPEPLLEEEGPPPRWPPREPPLVFNSVLRTRSGNYLFLSGSAEPQIFLPAPIRLRLQSGSGSSPAKIPWQSPLLNWVQVLLYRYMDWCLFVVRYANRIKIVIINKIFSSNHDFFL